MSLESWLASGQLRAKREIDALFEAVDRDLADAGLEGLSTDRRFATAYSAAMLVATIALAASGYRAQQEGHHYWTIQSLAFTLKLDAEITRQLDAFRRKRNRADYERAGLVSEDEAREMLALAKELRVMAPEWLKKNYAEFV
jgi:hypothetical protein